MSPLKVSMPQWWLLALSVLLSALARGRQVHGLYHQYSTRHSSLYPDKQEDYERMQQLQSFSKYSPPRTYDGNYDDGYGYQTRNTYASKSAPSGGAYGGASNAYGGASNAYSGASNAYGGASSGGAGGAFGSSSGGGGGYAGGKASYGDQRSYGRSHGKIETLAYNNDLSRHYVVNQPYGSAGYQTKTSYGGGRAASPAPPSSVYSRPFYKSGPGGGRRVYRMAPPPLPPPMVMPVRQPMYMPVQAMPMKQPLGMAIKQPMAMPMMNSVMMPVSYPTMAAMPAPVVKLFDPCSGLPEGDYTLEAEFMNLFPGVDPQCNFIKCANYKAFVNPCSIGTKNDMQGNPDADYGFCAVMDTKRYCGQYPASDGGMGGGYPAAMMK